MVAAALVIAQVLCSFAVDGEGPVRFGVPLPQTVLTRGMRLSGDRGASMQWSPLTASLPAVGDRLWVEVFVVGQKGVARLELGGAGASDARTGPVCREDDIADDVPLGRRVRHEWHWSDGSLDWRERTLLGEPDGDREVGETVTIESQDLAPRRTRVSIPTSFWRQAGVLPEADGRGREMRARLLEAVPRLSRAPGARGRGDHLRGGDAAIVTNGEFDTTLAFVRLALVESREDLLLRARECAWHMVDVDLERRSGLPFRHGPDHRVCAPETGHVWVEGVLLVAATCADRDLFGDGLSIALSLATRVRAAERREGIADRLRDEAWPLLELEATLAFIDAAPLRAVADQLAAAIDRRFDPAARTYRYGEGETRRGRVYRDRLWLSAGILLPALRAHARRAGPSGDDARVEACERAILEVLLDGHGGIPIQVMRGASGAFDASVVRGEPEGCLLIDGLSDRARSRVLSRGSLAEALDGILDPARDDLATRFSIVGRCTWVLR